MDTLVIIVKRHKIKPRLVFEYRVVIVRPVRV